MLTSARPRRTKCTSTMGPKRPKSCATSWGLACGERATHTSLAHIQQPWSRGGVLMKVVVCGARACTERTAMSKLRIAVTLGFGHGATDGP
jgi:hypothetical protein